MCTKDLFKALGMEHDGIEERIAGINHMAWLLEVKKDGTDLYPEIKRPDCFDIGIAEHGACKSGHWICIV